LVFYEGNGTQMNADYADLSLTLNRNLTHNPAGLEGPLGRRQTSLRLAAKEYD